MTADWTCPECGTRNADLKQPQCSGCGTAVDEIYFSRGTLCLVSVVSGKALTLRISTPVGRILLDGLGDADSRFADDTQFFVEKDSTRRRWMLRHASSARNPTCLDGAPVAGGPAALREGALITIGTARLKLKVQFQLRADPV